MDARVYELLNDQINKELHSSYLYLSFADYYEEEGLEGFANWYEIQAKEERDTPSSSTQLFARERLQGEIHWPSTSPTRSSPTSWSRSRPPSRTRSTSRASSTTSTPPPPR